MAARTIKQLVEDRSSLTLPAGDELSEILDEAAGEVLMDLPAEALADAVTETSVTTTGLDITDKIVTAVHVTGIQAKPFSTTFRKAFQDGNNSLRSEYGFDLRAGKLYVWQRGSSSALSTGLAYVITKPNGLAGTETDIAPIPHYDFVRLVAIRARIKLLQEFIVVKRSTDLAAYTDLTFGTLPTALSPPTITAGTITAGSATGDSPSAGAAPTPGTHGISAPGDETPPTIPTTPPDISDAEWTTFKSGTPPPTEVTSETTPTWPSDDFALPDGVGSDWEAYLNVESTEILDRLLVYFQRLMDERNTDVDTIIKGFQSNLALWQIEVQRLIENENWLSIFQTQTLNASVNEFSARVRESMDKFQNEIQGGIADARNATETAITKFRGDLEAAIAASSNITQADVATARMETDAQIAQTRADLEALIADWQADVQIHDQHLKAYLAEIERQVNVVETRIKLAGAKIKWAQDEISREEGRYFKKRNDYIDAYAIYQTGNLRAYAM